MIIAAARPASTVVLVRQPGLQVFLVRRHDNVAFMGGAHVFPGGSVDADDRLPNATSLCDGVDAAIARMSDLPPADVIGFHVAAVRELFEEAGVLLARVADGGAVPIDGASEARFERYREELLEGRIAIGELAARERLRLALDALALIGHWVTPEIEVRRFDTRFFLALAPPQQRAAHCQQETTDGVWLQPADAIMQARLGAIALPPPTWTTLRMLERFDSPEAAWRWAQTCAVPRVQPGFLERDDGTRIVALPGDPLCPEVPGFAVQETRFLLSKDGTWRPIAS